MSHNKPSAWVSRGFWSLPLLAGLGFLVGCPLVPVVPPGPNGVTAKQVQDLLAEKFNTADRTLSLWNIQPGLGTVMIEYGRRFALCYLAAQAEDWGMAQYQLKEATEIQEVGETTRPEKAELLKNFEHTYLDPLAQDIQNKDQASFNTHFDNAVGGCNSCHAGTGHPYITFQPPTTSPEDFLNLAASDPAAAEESGPAATPTPAPDQPLSWAELYDMVDDAFNNVDRQLTLWNIQPGLGTVMMEYGRRFGMMKSAADAGDWGMAQYQLKEAIEIQEVGETTRPGKADLLANFEHTYLDPLATAIEAQDAAAFETAFNQAIAGCNSCHQGTGHPYVRVQAPLTVPESFLALGPSAPTAGDKESVSKAVALPGHEDDEPTATGTPADFPPGNPTLEDAQKLIEDRFNTLDRTLALWNIQPGLGTVMMEYGHRFVLSWFAAQAGNWGMAEYQIKEATEIQEVGEFTRPEKANLLKNFEQTFLEPLNNAISAQDKAAFESSFKAAVAGCNSCHQGTGHPFIVVQEVPPANPADFLDQGGS